MSRSEQKERVTDGKEEGGENLTMFACVNVEQIEIILYA